MDGRGDASKLSEAEINYYQQVKKYTLFIKGLWEKEMPFNISALDFTNPWSL